MYRISSRIVKHYLISQYLQVIEGIVKVHQCYSKLRVSSFKIVFVLTEVPSEVVSTRFDELKHNTDYVVQITTLSDDVEGDVVERGGKTSESLK